MTPVPSEQLSIIPRFYLGLIGGKILSFSEKILPKTQIFKIKRVIENIVIHKDLTKYGFPIYYISTQHE